MRKCQYSTIVTNERTKHDNNVAPHGKAAQLIRRPTWLNKFPSRLTSSTRWRYQIFLAREKKKKQPHNSNFLSPIAQLGGGGGSCSRGCLVLTLQMTPQQKAQLSLSPAGEICSALQPLPSESLIHGRVRALPNPAPPPQRKLAPLLKT